MAELYLSPVCIITGQLYSIIILSDLNGILMPDPAAAPIYDLRQALKRGRLGGLNPIPWAFMAGNCLGWIAYGYYTKDPFIVAGNLPGFLVSLWLNSGAAKVQYYELYSEFKADDGAPSAEENEAIVTVPQERFFMRIMVGWSLLLVWVGWCQHFVSPAHIIGVCVNVNLGELEIDYSDEYSTLPRSVNSCIRLVSYLSFFLWCTPRGHVQGDKIKK
jgi:hypothetical protein